MQVNFHGSPCILGVFLYCSDFQPGFRGTQGFREHLPRVPWLVSKEDKNNLACEITSDNAIEVISTKYLFPN